MPNIDVSGLVTREVRYGENSRILTVLGKDTGKISILASRARTNKSGLLTATQLFAYSDFTLYKGREGTLLRLNEGEVIHPFSGIRNSLEKMAYASYFCDIINRLCSEGVEENELLTLILNMLYVLGRDDCTAEEAVKLRAVFQFRALAAAGFAPNCDGCVCCGSEDVKYFSHSGGGFLCKNCKDKMTLNTASVMPRIYGSLSEVNASLYNAVNYIVSADSKQILSFNLGTAAMAYLADIGEKYVKTQLEHEFKTAEYLKNVLSL